MRSKEELLRLIQDAMLHCACIKDMPGDNYTCVAHQKLREIALEEENK